MSEIVERMGAKLSFFLTAAEIDNEKVDVDRIARALLFAMREPTAEMIAEGTCQGDCPFSHEVWTRMIDAALK